MSNIEELGGVVRHAKEVGEEYAGAQGPLAEKLRIVADRQGTILKALAAMATDMCVIERTVESMVGAYPGRAGEFKDAAIDLELAAMGTSNDEFEQAAITYGTAAQATEGFGRALASMHLDFGVHSARLREYIEALGHTQLFTEQMAMHAEDHVRHVGAATEALDTYQQRL